MRVSDILRSNGLWMHPALNAISSALTIVLLIWFVQSGSADMIIAPEAPGDSGRIASGSFPGRLPKDTFAAYPYSPAGGFLNVKEPDPDKERESWEKSAASLIREQNETTHELPVSMDGLLAEMSTAGWTESEMSFSRILLEEQSIDPDMLLVPEPSELLFLAFVIAVLSAHIFRKNKSCGN